MNLSVGFLVCSFYPEIFSIYLRKDQKYVLVIMLTGFMPLIRSTFTALTIIII